MALFYAVDQEILEVPKHQSTKLYPREMVTLTLLCVIQGGGDAGLLPMADAQLSADDYHRTALCCLGPGPAATQRPSFFWPCR